MSKHAVKRLLAGTVPVLSLAGCGGSSAAPTTTLPPTTTVPPTTSIPPSTSTSIVPPCGTQSVTGPEIQMTWGSKSFGTVTATAYMEDDGRLCGATAAFTAPLLVSELITAETIPQLNAKVAKANQANVSAMSGATATSKAYVTSLQAALDSQ